MRWIFHRFAYGIYRKTATDKLFAFKGQMIFVCHVIKHVMQDVPISVTSITVMFLRMTYREKRNTRVNTFLYHSSTQSATLTQSQGEI